ncbi:MAG: sensor domain-containing diguanylate cyclase [Deltaproteobacteria bacterium]|nr:sensor domain-containing diguanylate cyclase [Deltaproteobacteria bacterium]
MDKVTGLLSLVDALRRASTLEEMLHAVTDAASLLLSVERVTLRLLDETRSRLLLAARAGRRIHATDVTFSVGEGLSGWVVQEGRPIRLERAELDPRFVVKPGQSATIASYLGVPLLDGGGAIGVLSATDEAPARFTADHEDIARLVVGICEPWVQGARLRRLALVDPLTAALNRRGFDAAFPRPADDPPCVLLLDLDHFKAVNDVHGHAVGDQVLKAVAAVLSGIARQGDDVVRLGGEEFLLVLRSASLSAGARVAERARSVIEALDVSDDSGRPVRVTASLGVALQRPGETRDALVARADAAMYRAKARGRNCVEIDEEPARGAGG